MLPFTLMHDECSFVYLTSDFLTMYCGRHLKGVLHFGTLELILHTYQVPMRFLNEHIMKIRVCYLNSALASFTFMITTRPSHHFAGLRDEAQMRKYCDAISGHKVMWTTVCFKRTKHTHHKCRHVLLQLLSKTPLC